MKAGKTGFSTFGVLNSFSECQTPSAFLSLVSKGMIVIVAVAVLDPISRSALNMPISSLQGLEILVDNDTVLTTNTVKCVHFIVSPHPAYRPYVRRSSSRGQNECYILGLKTTIFAPF